jgi:hypothetical protein
MEGGLVGAIGVDGVIEMPEMRWFLGGSRFVELFLIDSQHTYSTKKPLFLSTASVP